MKKETILVSIIIPVYNVRNYIAACLKSVSLQTYDGKIECLIIDDCGNDDSISLAKEFISKNSYPNISYKIIYHEKNKGLSGARNTGICEARGEWIYFLDSDDLITEDCIQLMVDLIKRYPTTQIVFSGAIATKGNYRYMDYECRANELPEHSDDYNWINWALLKHEMLAMTAWNKLFKRSFIIEHNLFFIEGLLNEDEVFHFLLAKYVSSLSILRKNTYVYTIRDNSIITSWKKESAELNWLTLFKIMMDNIGGQYYQRQVSAIFYHALMRVHWTDSAILKKGIKDMLLNLVKYGTLRQKAGLLLCTVVPIRYLEKTMLIAEILVGKVTC